MRRLYTYARTHSRLVFALAAVFLAGEAAYIGWQHNLQAQLLGRLASSDGIPGSVILTVTPQEKNVLSRRDRLHLTIASSVFSSDPSHAPVTLEFDVVANFGPFGLTGDVYPLNTTATTAGLLMKLVGIHPRFSVRYRISSISEDLRLIATAQPFDMTFEAVERGVGPMAWHVAAKSPATLRMKVPVEGPLALDLEVPDIELAVTDPALNFIRMHGSDSKVKLTARERPEKEPGDWYMEGATLTVRDGRVGVGDRRGILEAGFSKVTSRLSQTKAVQENLLDGLYESEAEKIRIRLSPTILVNQANDRVEKTLDGQDFRFSLSAKEVPVALFESLSRDHFIETLKAAGPMRFELADLSFSTGKDGKERASVSAGLNAELDSAGKANVEWNLAADLPQPVLEVVDLIACGNGDLPMGASVTPLMEKVETEGGSVWRIRLVGDSVDGVRIEPADPVSDIPVP